MSERLLIEQIRQQEPRLRRLGVRSLVLFGSQARAQSGPDSDVDLLYEFEEGAATLDHLLALRELLEQTLERPVDLVSTRHLSPLLARYIGNDRRPIFEAE